MITTDRTKKTVMQRTRRDLSSVVHDMIFESLKRNDEALAALAIEALVAIGAKTAHLLVARATTSHQAKYQLRLLQAIEEIGEFSSEEDYYDLTTLTRHKNARIREAASRAMLATRPTTVVAMQPAVTL